jgi:LysR family transcriptional regulator for bpeEF and oprC
MDKLSAMLTFVQIVETGSFTRAAEQLGIPKARASQRLRDLEDSLRIRLLERTTRALRLTDEGRAYHERCVRLLAEIDEAEQALRGRHAQPSGQLRVEAVAAIARHVLAPALADFHRRYPLLSVHLGSSDRIVHLLEDGVDCAIRGGELPDARHVARRVCSVQLGLYASQDFLARHGEPRDPAALAALPRLGWLAARGGGIVPWQLWCDEGHAIEVPGVPALAFDDGDAAVAAAVGGAGVVVAAPFAVRSRVLCGELRPVLPEWTAGRRPVNVVYASNHQLSARVRVFVDWAIQLMQADATMSLHPRELVALRAGP